MTEDLALAALMRPRFVRSFCMPRFTPPGWWECDMLEITKAGYFREYEVKITLADFKRDAEKSRNVGPMIWEPFAEPQVMPNGHQRLGNFTHRQEKKHDLLAAGHPAGPAEFFYVTPEGMLKPEMLPLWAGLIELRELRPSVARLVRREWLETVVVPAPRIHMVKAEAKVRREAEIACYWRFHRILEVRDVPLPVLPVAESVNCEEEELSVPE